jgi:hypothetical protein
LEIQLTRGADAALTTFPNAALKKPFFTVVLLWCVATTLFPCATFSCSRHHLILCLFFTHSRVLLGNFLHLYSAKINKPFALFDDNSDSDSYFYHSMEFVVA